MPSNSRTASRKAVAMAPGVPADSLWHPGVQLAHPSTGHRLEEPPGAMLTALREHEGLSESHTLPMIREASTWPHKAVAMAPGAVAVICSAA
jgi:hypothetical protein